MGASPSTPEVHNGDGGCFSVRCKSGPLEEYGKAVIRVGHDVRARAMVAAGKRGCGFVATPPRILFHPPCPALSRARRTPRSPARGLRARARPRVRPGSARLRLVSQTQTTPLPCAHSRTAPQYVRVMRAVEEVYDTSADRAADTLLLLTFGEIAKANSSARELMLKVDNADGVVVRFRATLRPPLRARTPRACAREAQGPAAHWPRFTPRAPPPSCTCSSCAAPATWRPSTRSWLRTRRTGGSGTVGACGLAAAACPRRRAQPRPPRRATADRRPVAGERRGHTTRRSSRGAGRRSLAATSVSTPPPARRPRPARRPGDPGTRSATPATAAAATRGARAAAALARRAQPRRRRRALPPRQPG